MDELEEFNRPVRNRYYDKHDWEEDEPSIEIPENIHNKYEKIEMVFDRICGYDVKIAEKESLNDRKCFDKINNQEMGSSNDFVYGEITFRTFSYVINHITYKLKYIISPGILYDLGSGSGRAIAAASLVYPFSKFVGIELLKSLYNMSINLKDKLRENSVESNTSLANVEFIMGNILEYEFEYNNTSLILANCKTFSKDLMQKIAHKLKQMPKGVILITTTQTLEDYDSDWEVVEKLRKLMSWGCANLYIQIKK